MEWILFAVYLVLFSWIITGLRFFRKSGIRAPVLVLLFIIKVGAGIAYYQFYSSSSNKQQSDTIRFFERSKKETETLLRDPISFVRSFFISGYDSRGGLFSDENSYWNDKKDDLMVKLMAVFNIFTSRNYLPNIVFFNFLFFIGLVAFYRLLWEVYNETNWLMIIGIFLVPSFLFWGSGIHKEGLIFTCVGSALYSFYRLLSRFDLRFLLVMVFCFLFLFFLRNFLLFLLIPSLAAAFVINQFPRKKMLVLSLFFVAGVLLVFTAKFIHPSFDVLHHIADKQAQFKTLSGGSEIHTPDLQPNAKAFFSFLPLAIEIAFFRPYPTESKSFLTLISSLEIILFWVLLITLLFFQRKNSPHHTIVIAGWIFSLAGLLVIGYTVHFSGAVVRYRSLYFPLILGPLLANLSQKLIYYKNIYIRK